ncbi:MAG: PstS family phosphate ABC transporter substrate-binding protein [Halobacterium sp.]
MTRDTGSPADSASRRKFIATTGAAGAALLAGCSSGGGNDSTTSPTDEPNTSGGSEPTTTQSSNQAAEVTSLEAGGSSTVYPIMSKAAAYWRANNPASDKEYWPHAEYGIETEKAFAEYWGGLYGFTSDAGGDPPFSLSVGLSHSGVGIEKVRNGVVDIGDSSAPVDAEKPDWPQSVKDKFVNHVIGVDGQPIVVSSEIKKAGVTEINGQELKDLYKGRISNWQELGGPDKKIQVLGRAKDSGTRTAFVSNVFGDPNADTVVANRFGQNQRLAQAIKQSDNAISYLALAFLDTTGVEPISLTWKGTTYTYGDSKNGLGAKEYPLSRDLHAYTFEGTSKAEAAIINMVLSDFGQDKFVAANNYFRLPDDRQQAQREKLPAQV